jgi:Nuclease A inhibitor-like protein
MAKKQNSALDVLQKACKGLLFVSESEDKLEAFVWKGAGDLDGKQVVKLAGASDGVAVEESSLSDFFHAVPPENKAKFDKLAKTLQEQLTGIKVYKVGDEAEKQAYIVGKTSDGQWAGLKTSVVET